MPLVTALMVFHRDTPFLRPAIASVLGQTLTDLELLLVDNGTGLTAETFGLSGKDPRVRWIRRSQNDGIPMAHNAGIEAARGEFVALLDYDDIALPNRFARQVEHLRRDGDIGLVSSLAETIDERGVVVGWEFALLGRAAQRAYASFAAPVVTPAYTGRRDVFARFPYRTEFPHAADFDFLTRAAEAVTMEGVPEVLTHYRRYAEQTTQARAAEIEYSRAMVRTAAARRLAGRPENLAELGTAVKTGSAPAVSCRWWAKCNLADGLPVLGAYHARRSIVLDRRPANVLAACRLGLSALRAATGDERPLARRMFFRGPVKALGLMEHRRG